MLGFSLPTEPPDDLLIIGAGPAGATAALYAARAGLRTRVVDKGLTAGALGMAGQIANFPGLPGPVSGVDLLRRMREQAASFGAQFVEDRVIGVDLRAEPKQVFAASATFAARAVILATGAMARAHPLPGEDRLIGRGVSYCATCDGAFFRDREVAVAGNTDEAVEEALTLTRFAARVHLLSPGAELRAAPHLVAELTAHPAVTLYPAARLLAVLGEERVEGVRFAVAGEERTLVVSGLFLYLQGNAPVVDFLGDQLPVGDSGCLSVDENFQTAIPGVFAVGDLLCRHLKQVVVAAAEGAVAAMAADRYLHGRERLRPDWAK